MAVAHVDAPQLAAGRRVVGHEPLRSGNDRLFATVVINNERRAKSTAVNAVGVGDGRSRRFPNRLAGLDIERDDELLISAIAGNDDELAVDDGRASGTGDFVVIEALFPKDLARLQIKANRAERTEVANEARAVAGGCGRGVAVVGVNRRRIVAGEQLDVAENLAVSGSDLDRVASHRGMNLQLVSIVAVDARFELLLARLRGQGGRLGSREPDAVANDDRRRPAAAWNFGLPGWRIESAPARGQVGRFGGAVAVWAAELRPIGRKARADEGGDHENCLK